MKLKFLAFFICLASACFAQSYPPAAGQPGSTAIAAEDAQFISWATGITVIRGLIDISNPNAVDNGSNFASFGVPEDALGPAANTPVSLGDAGEAVVTFDRPIANGPGFDFAVFENSFSDTFLELAIVEVSSDGQTFFRFPSHSETQTENQTAGFGDTEPTRINNLAGKYRALFGTPFDLSEIAENPALDKNNITHVKIIDVVGSIDATYARYDSFGNIINDPFTTPFFSGGFDLDAVGVINEQILDVESTGFATVLIYPNPVQNQLFITTTEEASFTILDMNGRKIMSGLAGEDAYVDVGFLKSGMYIIKIISRNNTTQYRFLKS